MLSGLNGTIRAAGGEEKRAFDPRLVGAAHQFEAMMMKELLAPLNRPALDGSEDADSGALGEFASESLAGALSAGGGLGVADRIVNILSHSGNGSGTGPATGKSPTVSGLSTGK